MIVEGMLCATVALVAAGRPEPARVALMSADEAAAGKDAWHTSAHQVFRCISATAPVRIEAVSSTPGLRFFSVSNSAGHERAT